MNQSKIDDTDLLIDDFQIEGEWWVPDSESDIWPGKLTYNPEDGLKLSLLVFRKGRHFPEHPPVLFGLDEQGKNWTAWRPFLCKTRSTFGAQGATYSCNAAICGRHVEEDCQLSGFKLSMTHFDHWAELSGFIESKEGGDDEIIRHRIPDLVSFDCGKGGVASIVSVRTNQADYFSRTISEKNSLDVSFPESISFKEVFGIKAHWEWLFSLFINSPIRTRQLSVIPQVPGGGFSDNLGVLLNQNNLPKKPERVIHTPEMTVTRTMIQDSLPEISSTWFEMVETHRAAISRFFATRYKHGLYTDEEFLFLCQVVESAMRTDLNRLSDHSLNLRGCIEKLVDDCRPYIDEIVSGWDGDFSDKVNGTRNFMIHSNPRHQERGLVMENTELFKANFVLQAMIKFYLLKKVGVSNDIASKPIARVKQARWFGYE